MTREDIERSNYILEAKNKFRLKYNSILTWYVLLIVVGYVIFFSSNIWMKKDVSSVRVTPINNVKKIENVEITLLDWKYSEKQQEMEVVLNVKNNGIRDIGDIEYKAAYIKSSSTYDVDEIINKKDLIVLHVKNVPNRWAAVRLNITLSQGECKLYTTEEAIKEVDDIQTKSYEEYMIEALENEQEYYLNLIDKENKAVDENNNTIVMAYKKLNELYEDMDYETPQEQAESQENIKTAFNVIEDTKDDIHTNAENIEEYTSQIINIKKKIELYREEVE